VRWQEFETACPELAQLAHGRFSADELVLLGSIRRDGSPRISPVEPDFARGELMLGMMWRSRKALDLLHDPRLVVHSLPSDKTNPGGDVKLYGTAVVIDDPQLRRAYEDAIFARINWRPKEPYHCFSVSVERGAFVRFEEEIWETWRWDPELGLRKETKPNDD
jgi:Pyridoxamine 5'-phosphate oxidase